MKEVYDELKAMLAGAQTEGAKTLLSNEMARMEAEARSAIQAIEAEMVSWTAEAQALWAKIKTLF